MAIQIITGNETGSQFIEKINNNFRDAGSGGGNGGFHVKIERGGLKNTGAMDYTITSYNGYIRSSMLIRCNGATTVIGLTLNGFTVYQYNASFAFITTSAEGEIFNANCAYVKIVKQTNDIIESAVLLFDADVEEVYNTQIESTSETLVFGVGEDICTTARLALPSNYAIDGKKVPLIIWCACDGSYPNWDFAIDQVGSSPASISPAISYLLSQGFAVLNVYPWGSYNFQHFPSCGQSGAVPVPVTLRAYEKAVEYVTTRFNISDTNIFLTSWSGSGKLSAHYAINKPSFNLRHIYAFSPVVDGGEFGLGEGLGGSSGFRGATDSEMHFDDINGLRTKYVNGDNLSFLGSGKTLTDADVITFRKLNAGKFAKFSSIQWDNLVGCYLKNGVLHQHNIDDKIEDSLNWAKTWLTDTDYATYKGNPSQVTYTAWSSFRGRIYNRYDLAIISNGAPITIIGAEDDCACPFMAMEQFIIQLQNGGAEAKIIILPNESSANGGIGTGHSAKYGHRAPVFENSVVQYGGSNVGYGWSYAVQDIKTRFLKQQ